MFGSFPPTADQVSICDYSSSGRSSHGVPEAALAREVTAGAPVYAAPSQSTSADAARARDCVRRQPITLAPQRWTIAFGHETVVSSTAARRIVRGATQ